MTIHRRQVIIFLENQSLYTLPYFQEYLLIHSRVFVVTFIYEHLTTAHTTSPFLHRQFCIFAHKSEIVKNPPVSTAMQFHDKTLDLSHKMISFVLLASPTASLGIWDQSDPLVNQVFDKIVLQMGNLFPLKNRPLHLSCNLKSCNLK